MTKLINLKELFPKTWGIYQKKLKIFVTLLVGPFLLLTVNPFLGEMGWDLPILGSLVVDILACLSLIWAGIAILLVLSDKEKPYTWQEALRASQSKFWSLVWISILTGFIVSGSFFLFVIPALIFSIFFIFAQIFNVVEGDKGLKALVRSRELVRAYFWPVVGRYLALMIFSLIAYSVFGSILGVISALVSSLNSLAGTIVVFASQVALNVLVAPFCLIYVYLMYENLKQIKGDIAVGNYKKTGVGYLLTGLFGWVFLVVVFALFSTILMSAWGDYLLNALSAEIYNKQVLLKGLKSN